MPLNVFAAVNPCMVPAGFYPPPPHPCLFLPPSLFFFFHFPIDSIFYFLFFYGVLSSVRLVDKPGSSQTNHKQRIFIPASQPSDLNAYGAGVGIEKASHGPPSQVSKRKPTRTHQGDMRCIAYLHFSVLVFASIAFFLYLFVSLFFCFFRALSP